MTWVSRVVQVLREDRIALISFSVIVFLLLVSLILPLLPIGQPDEVGYGPRIGAPSWAALFGTDHLGRPVLARLVQGLQMTFLLLSIKRNLLTPLIQSIYLLFSV